MQACNLSDDLQTKLDLLGHIVSSGSLQEESEVYEKFNVCLEVLNDALEKIQHESDHKSIEAIAVLIPIFVKEGGIDVLSSKVNQEKLCRVLEVIAEKIDSSLDGRLGSNKLYAAVSDVLDTVSAQLEQVNSDDEAAPAPLIKPR